ncbi:hypothetical protein AVEN_198133-1 [Araneus ventricosus]|uniref:Uncharacterized protein n=1 Tax=Araneus ventricosus TaxID=182803 RepID=A0A4Y2JDC1_ARAVE|nr:hypothetical protein AVEN_198133-1 [Araneus ventricosus]
MDLRKWISNDANLMEQWKKKTNGRKTIRIQKTFILQAVERIFDPLGLITPFTIRVKCLIHDLWSEKIPWDDPLPPHPEKEWKRWNEELPHLENLKYED